MTVITAGVEATIELIKDDPGGGPLPGVQIASYEANITFPAALAEATDCRLKPPFDGGPSPDCSIGPGLVHLRAGAAIPAVAPIDPLAFVALRLVGSNDPVAGLTTVELNFVAIRDSLGSLIPQAAPLDSRTFLRGDALADGGISIGDALFIGQHLVNAATRPAGEGAGEVNPINAASVSHDGANDVISVADAVLIAQFLVGSVDSFYIGPP